MKTKNKTIGFLLLYIVFFTFASSVSAFTVAKNALGSAIHYIEPMTIDAETQFDGGHGSISALSNQVGTNYPGSRYISSATRAANTGVITIDYKNTAGMPILLKGHQIIFTPIVMGTTGVTDFDYTTDTDIDGWRCDFVMGSRDITGLAEGGIALDMLEESYFPLNLCVAS